jgi:drug/metabolite transporter (DMT)-like permease
MSALASRSNLIGIASLVAGIFVFSLQDTIIKSISGAHAVTLAIFLRAIVSFPILWSMVHWETGIGAMRTKKAPLLLARGFILFSAYICYYLAIAELPLAEAIALFFMAPLMITILSGPMLGEHVPKSAWAAVVIGLAGVFTILRPGSELFQWAALLSLVSAATYAYAMVLARKFAADVPTGVMSSYQNISYIIASPILGFLVTVLDVKQTGVKSIDFLVRGWAWPNLWDASLMAACGIIAAIAATLLTHAYRKGEAGVVTPFEYTGLMWGTVWGYVIFHEVPKPATLLGMALIAVAGILALRAARRRV